MKKTLFILSIFSIFAVLIACGSDSGNSAPDDSAVTLDSKGEVSSSSLGEEESDEHGSVEEKNDDRVTEDEKNDVHGTNDAKNEKNDKENNKDNEESNDGAGKSSSSSKIADDYSSSSKVQPLSSSLKVSVLKGDCGFSTQPWADDASSQVTLKADSAIYFLVFSNRFKNWDDMGNVNELEMDLFIDGVQSQIVKVSRWTIGNASLKAPAQSGTHTYKLVYEGGEVCSATMDVLGGSSSSNVSVSSSSSGYASSSSAKSSSSKAVSSSSAKSSSSKAESSSSAKSSSSKAVSSSSAKSSSSKAVSSSSAESSCSSKALSSSSLSDIKPYGYYSDTCSLGNCTYVGVPSTLNKTMLEEGLYGEFLDTRDKKVYRTVKIGNQVWMAQNLDYRYVYPTAQLDSSSFCYDNDAGYCVRYGRLYVWSAVMDSAAKLKNDGKGAGCGEGVYCKVNNKGSVQGVCPANWHVPSMSEFVTLIQSVDSSFEEAKDSTAVSLTAGQYFKSTTLWKNSYNGTNSTGFTALPSGYFISDRYLLGLDGYYVEEGKTAQFWSSSELYSNNSYEQKNDSYRMYFTSNLYTNRAFVRADLRVMGNSVRCVHD